GGRGPGHDRGADAAALARVGPGPVDGTLAQDQQGGQAAAAFAQALPLGRTYVGFSPPAEGQGRKIGKSDSLIHLDTGGLESLTYFLVTALAEFSDFIGNPNWEI